jgi:hypothetical protein
MLYLKPPFPVIEGIAFFPDHADELLYFYLPASPHLTTLPDPQANRQIPQIQLLKFRGGDGGTGSAGNGGFLTFEVDLGIDDTRLDDLAQQVKALLHLREKPRLSPALLEGGAVNLVMMGLAFDANGKPILDDNQQPRFVVRKSPSAKPALYGRNEAIFSVELDQWGVELVETSLANSEVMPIGVVYSLDFLALRPAFSVRIHADWNRVQTHFEESFKVDVLFASSEIDKVVDKLVEDQVVQIEVDSFLPEGEDAGSWVGRRDQAINQFKDMVLENFFKPSLDPMKGEPKDGWDKAGDLAERLALIGATGGLGGAVKFSYVKKDLTRIDQKRANLTMNERVTVKRSIYPQAILSGLARVLRDANGQIDKGRFVQDVTLGADWFQKRKVKAHALVDWDNDNVDSVNLTLAYDGRPRTIRLTKAQPDGEQAWNSVVKDDKMVRPVAYQYSVNFRGVDTAERPGTIASMPLGTVGDEFEVSPRGEPLYFIDAIVVGAGALPWDRYPQVEVELRYEDPANHIKSAETFLLSKDKPEATWKRFRLDAARNQYDVRISFLAADNRDVQLDWTTTDQERLVIRDPHPLRRTVQVAPAVDWRLVSMIFLELRYLDEENGIDEQRTLAFFDTNEDRGPKTFSVNLADGRKRLVSYAPTFVLKDNRTISVPRSMTAGSTIILRTDMAGHRVVTVAPPATDFARRGIVRIEAELAYADADAGLSFEDRFTFGSASESGLFEFDYASAAHSSYSCKSTVVLANGLVLENDLGSQGGDKLVLPVA